MKKQMTKKLFCAVMSVVMISGVIIGCSNHKDTDDNGKVTVEENTIEANGSETQDAEKDEYLTIDTDTICKRELHDFFQIYLGCWLDFYHNSNGKEPKDITTMLTHTGVTGLISTTHELRVPEGYDDNNYIALNWDSSGEKENGLSVKDIAFKHHKTKDRGTVNYSCSVANLESNFLKFKYKAGTDAELHMIVEVTYNCSGVTSETEKIKYAVALVNDSSNPDEWLIDKVYAAFSAKNGYYHDFGYAQYYVTNNADIQYDTTFTEEKLVNEDGSEAQTVKGKYDGFEEWQKQYIKYFDGKSGRKVLDYKFIKVKNLKAPVFAYSYNDGTGVAGEILSINADGKAASLMSFNLDNTVVTYNDDGVINIICEQDSNGTYFASFYRFAYQEKSGCIQQAIYGTCNGKQGQNSFVAGTGYCDYETYSKEADKLVNDNTCSKLELSKNASERTISSIMQNYK